MAHPDIDTVLGWRGRTIVDENGEKIGKFEDIYLDTQTERPEWAAVKRGLFSRGRLLVPLSEAEEHDDDTLRVPFAKAHIENAPDVDADGELSQQEEARLYEHYGLEYSQEQSSTGLPSGEAQEPRPGDPDATPQGGAPTESDQSTAGGEAQPRDAAASGDETAEASRGADQTAAARGDRGTAEPRSGGTEAALSEEEIESIDVEQQPRERVRLKKYVVTEEVTKTVPVQREEVRVEREPLEREDPER